jgi:hypothetical protein
MRVGAVVTAPTVAAAVATRDHEPELGGGRARTAARRRGGVDSLRAAADLEPLADYLAEMAEICSAD